MAEIQVERPSIKERVSGVAERVGKRLKEWGKDRFGSDEVVAANLNYYENVHNALSGKPKEVFKKLRGPWERFSRGVGITATAMDAGLAAVWGTVGYRVGRRVGGIMGFLGFGLGGMRATGEAMGVSTAVRAADQTMINRPFRRLYRKEAEIMGKVVPKAIETVGNLQDRVSGVIDRLRNTWRKPPEESNAERVFVGRGRAT